MSEPRFHARVRVWLFGSFLIATGGLVSLSECGTSSTGAAPQSGAEIPPPDAALPDAPHGSRRGVIVPSDVPVGGSSMGATPSTGTTGPATTPENLGKGTLGTGAN